MPELKASPLRIDRLPEQQGTEGFKVIDVLLSSEDRRRVRRRLTAPDGQELVLALATGTVLKVGELLCLTESTAYRIAAAPEDVLSLSPATLEEAAMLGHMVGNLHRDMVFEEGHILVLWDAPLERRLQQMGVHYQREQRAFKGKPAGEHSH